MTDLIGWIGYLFFLGIIGASGILAIVTAYYLRGAFKILYIAGILAILSSASYLPLSFTHTALVDFHPEISDPQFLVGKWMDDTIELELISDSIYILNKKTGFLFRSDNVQNKGTWRLDRNKLYLQNLDSTWYSPWEVLSSDGYYFIAYYFPENFDAWSGYLGLMRETEWLADQ